MPSKGVLIRLCIYGPLLAYFGYMAYQKYKADHVPAEAPALEGRTHTFALPDGKSVEVVEITEDQARAMGLDPSQLDGPKAPAKAADPAPAPDAAKSPAPAPAPDAAKSPAPAPAGAN